MNTIINDTELVIEISKLLEQLVKAVVQKPEAVKIKHSTHGPLAAFVISTDPGDVRRVIGAKGKHFKALKLIISSLTSLIGREAHIEVEDKGPPIGESPMRTSAFVKPRDLAPVEKLLNKTISMFLDQPGACTISTTEVGTTMIFEVKVNSEANHARIYGPLMSFEYGADGAIIGSIKNLFDGIGKNHGRLIRIVLSQPA